MLTDKHCLSHGMCLYQVMMTLHFLNDVVNDAESTQNKTKLCSGPASRVHIVNVFTVDMKKSNKQEWNQIQISQCNLK